MKALAAGLRKFRLKELDDWSDTEIGHIAEVLDLLGDIAGNSRFSDTKRSIEPNLAEGAMCQFFAFVLNSEIQSQTGQKTGIAAVSRFQIANPKVSLHNIHYGT